MKEAATRPGADGGLPPAEDGLSETGPEAREVRGDGGSEPGVSAQRSDTLDPVSTGGN